MNKTLLSILLVILPLGIVFPSSLSTNTSKQMPVGSTLPASNFYSTSVYNNGSQSSSFANSASERMVGTTTLPVSHISAPYDEWDEWEDNLEVSGSRSPRRSPGDPHSGGTSVDTPGASLGGAVVPLLILCGLYAVIRAIINKRKELYQNMLRLCRRFYRKICTFAKIFHTRRQSA